MPALVENFDKLFLLTNCILLFLYQENSSRTKIFFVRCRHWGLLWYALKLQRIPPYTTNNDSFTFWTEITLVYFSRYYCTLQRQNFQKYTANEKYEYSLYWALRLGLQRSIWQDHDGPLSTHKQRPFYLTFNFGPYVGQQRLSRSYQMD